MMSPIESIHDCRLAALLGVLMSLLESLAVEVDTDPDTLLAEHLFIHTKRIYALGEEATLRKVEREFPILIEALN